jgi:hypothetical protein
MEVWIVKEAAVVLTVAAVEAAVALKAVAVAALVWWEEYGMLVGD